MKKVIIIVFVMIIFYAGITLAERQRQIRVRTFDSIEWGGDTRYGWIEKKCRKYCNRKSGDVDEYLQRGWQIISMREIIITESPFQVMQYTGYCKCIGAEYILKRGD